VMTPSRSGFLLLGPTMSPMASNPEAIQILSYPSKPDRIKQLDTFLSDRVKAVLLDHQSDDNQVFVRECRSGRRRYVCRSFRVGCDPRYTIQPATAIILERNATGTVVMGEAAKQFELTEREQETVQMLLQGLTSKEIAVRMGISPNTVKAFLRLVMVKMGVSTRSGIVGRIAGLREEN
jgi:DNA-binding CsgD family transcriptional regulator